VSRRSDHRLAAQDRPRGLGHAQRAVALGIGAQQVMAHHLPEHRLPALAVELRPTPKVGKRSWPAGAHLLGLVARQDVDQVPRAEIFARAQDADSAFCTAVVASKVSGGLAQRSQFPQGSAASPK
jgi:predicted aconitase